MSLKSLDLRHTVLPKISIDEYEPKAGDVKDCIVVAFYLIDEPPAEDLNTFIQRGFIETLDVEVSPSTDQDGRYLLFVEFARNPQFLDRFKSLVKDIENLTGRQKWRVETYYTMGTSYDLHDPMLANFLILEPEKYMTKAKFSSTNIKESVQEFFSDAHITQLTLDKNIITISNGRQTILAEVVDIGSYDTVIGRSFLAETAFTLQHVPYETNVLKSMLLDYSVAALGDYVCINRNDSVLLLKNTQLNYRKN